MKIRTATKKDWQHIEHLIRAYPTTLMQDHLPKPTEFCVAVENEKVIGCCALEVYSKRLAEIRSLVVAEEYRGKGIATQLVQQCLDVAKKKKVYEVLSISGALPLFERHGFNTFNNEKYALLKILGK